MSIKNLTGKRSNFCLCSYLRASRFVCVPTVKGVIIARRYRQITIRFSIKNFFTIQFYGTTICVKLNLQGIQNCIVNIQSIFEISSAYYRHFRNYGTQNVDKDLLQID